MEIVPAIIARDFEELKSKIKKVEPFVNWVQIDVMDGVFAPNKNWNEPNEFKNIEINLDLEVHLMVEDIEEEIERWIDSGVKRILVHWEAWSKSEVRSKKLEDIFKKCAQHQVKLGLVLNLETPIEVLNSLKFLLRNSNFLIQLMSIAKIGYHGEPFDERVIPKIKALRRKYPDVKIEVDGGINQENAPKIAEAGADVLVVGSAIFNNQDIEKSIQEFKKIAM